MKQVLTPAERRTRRRLMAAGLLLGVSGRALAEIPAVVEWHRVWWFPKLTTVLQTVSGGLSSTIGEVMWAIVVVAAMVALVRFNSRAVAPLVLVTGVLVAAFYATWGLAYQYARLSSRLSPLPAEDMTGEVSKVKLIDLTRRSALLLARASENAPDWTGDDHAALDAINAGLTSGFAAIPGSIEASPIKSIDFGPAKFSRISFALSRFQVSGYYSPWTGEAQIDSEMPRSLWPRVAAHEKAHQRGFARENEATVIGLLACLSSPDPRVFYGGAVGLFVGFDRELAHVDKDARKEAWSLLPPRVVAQLENESAFWKAHEGAAADVSEKVNDTYLKAQGVASGVGSYAETTRLLLQAMETRSLTLRELLGSVANTPTKE